ncbi:MAG: hypothetical protein COB04_13185 [Gammaproteobacteria bacterium]|nr:MAG: hypothetical protein COB04_13185 [Gammaproteobacteria bacterium]
MSNISILERLLKDIEAYDSSRKDRDGFARRFIDAIESLEAVPYTVITEARDWQYNIETEGYFEDEDCEANIEEVIPKLKAWIHGLIEAHS